MTRQDSPQIDSLYQVYDRGLNRISGEPNALLETIYANQSDSGHGSTVVEISPGILGPGDTASQMGQAVGYQYSGKSSFTDPLPGYIFGIDKDGVAKFLFGNDTQFIFWNGTSMTVAGSLNVGDPSSAEVVISGNDINLYDASTGGGGTISGDTASISFIRRDGNPGKFIMQKRHSKNNDLGNVEELFYDADAAAESNYIFIGRDGIGNNEINHTDFVVLHGKNSVRAEVNSINNYTSRPPFVVFDVNTVNASLHGVNSYLFGEGNDGLASLGYLLEYLVFSDSPNFKVGDTITGNATGATLKITYKIDANNYLGNHLSASFGINFNGATDNACTTNGAGGGSGTGNLASTTDSGATILSVDSSLNAILGSNFIPDTDNAYDIGSASKQIKDIYFGGSLIGPGAPSGKGADVQVFTSSNTWTKPAGAKMIHVICIGAGGNGSIGGLVQSSTDGATGGGGGARTEKTLDATNIANSITVTVATPGATPSSFGTILYAYNGDAGSIGVTNFSEYGGGGGGSIGNASAQNGGLPATALANGFAGQGAAGGGISGASFCAEWGGGGGSSNGSLTSNTGGSSLHGGGGGGRGGWQTHANMVQNNSGTDGGICGSYTPGGGGAGGAGTLTGTATNGTDGTSRSGTGLCGDGGGGGGAATTGTAGNGGNGGIPGGGGGGGGCTNGAGVAGGKGTGGRGEVIVITTF